MGGNEVVIVQILAVVLILFFCFVTYMNTKTWRATHVTFLFLVFGAAMTFSVYASLILKTRKAWQKITGELEKREDKDIVDVGEALYGKKNDPANPGLAAWREAVHRAYIDRGRVWRDCAVTSVEVKPPEMGTQNSTVVVSLRTAPADDRGEKADWSKMNQDTVVYAFRELNPASPHTSYGYAGEFYASAVSETSITLTSTQPMTPFDQGAVGDKNDKAGKPSLWILYERMPIDSQEVFFQEKSDTFHPLAVKPSDLLRVGDFNEEGTLLKDPKAHEKVFQEILWEYERDGMTYEQMQADRAAKGQPPLPKELEQERMLAEVKFTKDYEVDVDAGQQTPPDVGNADTFDSTGKALDPRLQRGRKASFKAGESARMILDGYRDKDGGLLEKGARELQEDGVLTITTTIYHRPLNDYAYAFTHIYARNNQIAESLALVLKETAVVAEETAAAQKNTKLRQAEKSKLAEDNTQLSAERQKIGKYADDLEASYRGVRSELSRLYRENAALHERILAANEKLTREIEARSTTPTALEK